MQPAGELTHTAPHALQALGLVEHPAQKREQRQQEEDVSVCFLEAGGERRQDGRNEGTRCVSAVLFEC